MAMPILEGDSNPLSPEEWGRLTATVVGVARRALVARRFIDLYGPLGAGVQTVAYDEYSGVTAGAVDLVGEQDAAPVFTDVRPFRTIPLLYKDFRLHWRDVEAARSHNLPLEVSAAAGAAALCARREDELVFHGDERLGIDGLFNAPGRLTSPLTDWQTPGHGFANVVEATERLHRGRALRALRDGASRPACSPCSTGSTSAPACWRSRPCASWSWAACTSRACLQGEAAVVVSTGAENLDLAVALDLTVAYLGAEKMNHPFRVLEALLPRIKHPDAICTLERGA